jgi:hypothetical protein
MARTKSSWWNMVKTPHMEAWEPSVLPKPKIVKDHYLSRSKVFFEIKVEARTRGEKKKRQKQYFFERLVRDLPVEIVVQVSTDLVWPAEANG